jgi:uncharacterized membrane protein HdeD (DUF308 family)
MPKDPVSIQSEMTTAWVSIGAALALILLGAIAALVPLAVGIAVSMFVVWVIVFSGLAHLVHAWDARGDAIFLWRLLVGFVYLAGGIYLVLNPEYGLGALTAFMGGVFVAEALLLLAAGWWLRRAPGSRWFSLDGGFSLLMAAAIFGFWPWTAGWFLGVLVGINLISSGLIFLLILQENRIELGRKHV